MGPYRLLARAEADLDAIWPYLARESGSVEIAKIGRRRDNELRPGLRSFVVGDYVIICGIDGEDVLILHVIRGSRDIPELLENT